MGVRHVSGSKVQGYAYMKKKTPWLRGHSTFQERRTDEVTMPRHSDRGQRRGEHSLGSVLVKSPNSQAVSWALQPSGVKSKKEWNLFYLDLFYLCQGRKEIWREM